MTRLSTEGTQRIPQKVLTLSWKVEECKPLQGGQHRVVQLLRAHGKAVQVEPIKPMLKAPGIHRLKRKYDKTAFNFASILLSKST